MIFLILLIVSCWMGPSLAIEECNLRCWLARVNITIPVNQGYHNKDIDLKAEIGTLICRHSSFRTIGSTPNTRNNSFALSFEDFASACTGNWSASLGLLSAAGTVHAAVKTPSRFSGAIVFEIDHYGLVERTTVRDLQLEVHIADLHLTASDKALQWIANKVLEFFRHDIEDDIDSTIRKKGSEGLSQLVDTNLTAFFRRVNRKIRPYAGPRPSSPPRAVAPPSLLPLWGSPTLGFLRWFASDVVGPHSADIVSWFTNGTSGMAFTFAPHNASADNAYPPSAPALIAPRNELPLKHINKSAFINVSLGYGAHVAVSVSELFVRNIAFSELDLFRASSLGDDVVSSYVALGPPINAISSQSPSMNASIEMTVSSAQGDLGAAPTRLTERFSIALASSRISLGVHAEPELDRQGVNRMFQNPLSIANPQCDADVMRRVPLTALVPSLGDLSLSIGTVEGALERDVDAVLEDVVRFVMTTFGPAVLSAYLAAQIPTGIPRVNAFTDCLLGEVRATVPISEAAASCFARAFETRDDEFANVVDSMHTVTPTTPACVPIVPAELQWKRKCLIATTAALGASMIVWMVTVFLIFRGRQCRRGAGDHKAHGTAPQRYLSSLLRFSFSLSVRDGRNETAPFLPSRATRNVSAAHIEDDGDVGDMCSVLHDSECARRGARPLLCGSLAASHTVSPWIAAIMPLVILLTWTMFISSNTSIGAELLVGYSSAGDYVVTPPLFQFTLKSSVVDMWNAGLYPLSAIIAVFSGFWPHCKLFMMYLCFVLPRRVFPTRYRERVLMVVDALGKYSLVDSFVLVIFMVAFRITINAPALPAAGVTAANAAVIDIFVSPTLGFWTFIFPTLLSLVLNHVLLYIHRRQQRAEEGEGVLEPSQVDEEEDDEVSLLGSRVGSVVGVSPEEEQKDPVCVDSGEDAVNTSDGSASGSAHPRLVVSSRSTGHIRPRQRTVHSTSTCEPGGVAAADLLALVDVKARVVHDGRYAVAADTSVALSQFAVRWARDLQSPLMSKVLTRSITPFVSFLLVFSLVSLSVTSFFLAFRYTYFGLAKLAFEWLNLPVVTRYSVLSIGLRIPDATSPHPYPLSYVLELIFFSFVLAVPLMLLLSFLTLWLLPLRHSAQRRVYVATEVLNAWSALDVFFLSVIASLLQLRQFAAFIVGDRCDAINAAVQRYVFKDRFPVKEICFEVVAALEPAAYSLLAAIVVHLFVSIAMMSFSHRALESRSRQAKIHGSLQDRVHAALEYAVRGRPE